MSARGPRWVLSFLFIALAFMMLHAVPPAEAEPLRIATFNTELSRKGPGLLLRDITRGSDPQVQAVVAVIASHHPDILALQGIDWDHDNLALKALQSQLAEAGADYRHVFARQPNAGRASVLDLDGDGRLGGAGDSQGFGNFTGRGGIAVLSRFPILSDEVLDLTPLLWRDMPGAQMPRHPDGRPFPSAEAQAIQRLSSTAHWALPIALPDGEQLTLLTFQAAPPLFDGPEQRNQLRNADEVRLWQRFLDGQLPAELGLPPKQRFVLAGGTNLDPTTGAGQRAVMAQLLADPRFQDVIPTSAQAESNTVEWRPGSRMRVDYVLPSTDLRVISSGVAWPQSDQDPAATASRHRLVWVDVAMD